MLELREYLVNDVRPAGLTEAEYAYIRQKARSYEIHGKFPLGILHFIGNQTSYTSGYASCHLDRGPLVSYPMPMSYVDTGESKELPSMLLGISILNTCTIY